MGTARGKKKIKKKLRLRQKVVRLTDRKVAATARHAESKARSGFSAASSASGRDPSHPQRDDGRCAPPLLRTLQHLPRSPARRADTAAAPAAAAAPCGEAKGEHGVKRGRGRAGGRASALTLRAPGPGPCLGRPRSAARLGGRRGPPPVRAEKVCAVRADAPHLRGGEGGAGRAALPARDYRAAPPEVRPAAAATAAPGPAPRAASAIENSAGSGGCARSAEVWGGGRRTRALAAAHGPAPGGKGEGAEARPFLESWYPALPAHARHAPARPPRGADEYCGCEVVPVGLEPAEAGERGRGPGAGVGAAGGSRLREPRYPAGYARAAGPLPELLSGWEDGAAVAEPQPGRGLRGAAAAARLLGAAGGGGGGECGARASLSFRGPEGGRAPGPRVPA